MKTKIILALFFILFCSSLSYGQKKVTLSGTVVDMKKMPVAGAAIFIDNVNTNSLTDQKGFYRVKVNAAAKEILVISLFYGASEQSIDGRTQIDFIMTGKSVEAEGKKNPGENEIINIGYGTARKKDVTNQTGVIDAQKPEFASYQNIYDMIRGRVPGVEVSGTSIKIMGSSSLNISTEPIFVVDGVIVNTIDDIPPQTVKSIEVLKGPAASVYGMRGSNGVIVITRLSGKDTKTEAR
jgi:TonB-dependent SusC/RagA subfamily outer membrane receptor